LYISAIDSIFKPNGIYDKILKRYCKTEKKGVYYGKTTKYAGACRSVFSKTAQAERKVRPSTANRPVQFSTVSGDLIWIMPTQGLLKAFGAVPLHMARRQDGLFFVLFLFF